MHMLKESILIVFLVTIIVAGCTPAPRFTSKNRDYNKSAPKTTAQTDDVEVISISNEDVLDPEKYNEYEAIETVTGKASFLR